MKKRWHAYPVVLATIVSGLLVLTGCDDEVRISYGKLPAPARAFIETFFPAESCVRAGREKDDGRKEYKVELSNGTEIVFDASGEWIEVDCKFSALPGGVLPGAVSAHIAGHYPQCVPYKVERQAGGYEVSVSGSLELVYSAEGTFVREQRDF